MRGYTREIFRCPNPNPHPGQSSGGDRAYSVRAMMSIIIALAPIFAVLSPLYHFGRPPCLTPVKTGVWLVAKPATASCTDCHGRR